MKNELQNSQNKLEVEIRTEEEFMDLAQKTNGQVTENVAGLIKENFTWMQRNFGSRGLRTLIRELNDKKLQEVQSVFAFRKQLMDLAQRAQIDALKKKYMVLISAYEAVYQERLIQLLDDLLRRLTINLREGAKEMLDADMKDYEDAERYRSNKKKYDQMIAYIDKGSDRYFRIMNKLFDGFETDMNANIQNYKKQIPDT